jgi:hypothetical protein
LDFLTKSGIQASDMRRGGLPDSPAAIIPGPALPSAIPPAGVGAGKFLKRPQTGSVGKKRFWNKPDRGQYGPDIQFFQTARAKKWPGFPRAE